ncbi:MAG TPA: hypothetical protein VN887_18565 [Candidatus Angelobacter sp.]|nr:hypothetical protein [Candidatus Angelobacter sp.]
MEQFIPQYFAATARIELLLCALAVSLVVWPVMLRRRRSMDPAVVETLLQRVHKLREQGFQTRRARVMAVKTRAKLLAAARERIKREKGFLRQQA